MGGGITYEHMLITNNPLPHIVAYPLIGEYTPPPLRMPPIYDILTGKKGGQSPLQNIRKKNSGKIFGKKWKLFPPIYNRMYLSI